MSYEFIQLALEGRKQISLGDHFHLMPLNGRRSQHELTRTYVEFAGHDQLGKKKANKIELGALKNESLRFSFTYHQYFKKNSDQRGFYVLESLTDTPFMHNNIYTFKAIIENNDEVWMGHNRVVFNSQSNSTPPEQVLAELRPEVVRSELPIYLEGETGTGKSTLAKQIHEQSGVRGNFVQVNLASFSPGLIESELFGHKRGSFTGALCDRPGALMQASHGTLFLDEIDSLPLEIQTKLLLFLDSGEFRPVGSFKVEKMKFRLITASGKKLQKLVENNLFRNDLYFRLLAGFKLELPSLCNQVDLIRNKIIQFSTLNHISMTERLVDFYCQQLWPGNLRQLNAHLLRKKVLSRSKKWDIDQTDVVLKQNAVDAHKVQFDWCSLEEMKRSYAQKVYFFNKNNLNVASNILDITPKTLKRLVV